MVAKSAWGGGGCLGLLTRFFYYQWDWEICARTDTSEVGFPDGSVCFFAKF